MKNLLIALSFLIIAACANFDNNTKTNEQMAQTINIPGGEVQLSGNPIWVETTTTTSGMTNHHILLKVTSTDGKVPGGPWVDHINPVGGEARFDISGLVDYEFDHIFDYEHQVSTFDRNLLMAQFSVQVGEYYVDGSGVEVEAWGDIETISVIKGELDKYEIARLESDSSSFYKNYIEGMKFLTQMSYQRSDRKRIINVNDYTDPVKIWFMIYDLPFAEIRMDIHYNDGYVLYGSKGAWTDLSYLFVELNADKLITEANSFNTFIDKGIDYYEISVFDYGTYDIFGIIRVNVNNRYSENHEVLYCLNNLGAVEAVNCYGEITEKRNIDKIEYTQAQSVSPTLLESTLKSRRTSKTEGFKINTGYKSLDERRWIAGLLECEKAWLKSERLPHLPGKNYGFVPVVVEPGSFDIDTTSEDLMAIEIELKIAHN